MSTDKTNATNHLNAFTVEEYESAKGKTARRWTRIGVAFPHKEGTGYNIELKALPLDGRIILLPPDPAGEERDDRNSR